MDVKPDFFLDEIFKIEAEGMLSDIIFSTFMASFLLDFNEDMHRKAIKYISDVLDECYKEGHLKVAIQHEGETLCGFALLFVHPNHSATYLHKIFVREEYRNNGLGTNILKNLIGTGSSVNLLCSDDKFNFYEKNGFNYVSPFKVPESENFKLSKGLYSGLAIMSSSKDAIEAPIFFLNDNDLKIIAGLEKKI